MRSILIASAVCLFAIPAHADIHITADPGGNLAAYQAKVYALLASGERVTIDGQCNSACTLYLTLPKGQVCVTRRASFTFHAATDSRLGLPLPNQTLALFKAYPPAIQIWIGRHGGLSWIPIRMGSGDAASIVGTCR